MEFNIIKSKTKPYLQIHTSSFGNNKEFMQIIFLQFVQLLNDSEAYEHELQMLIRS